jgi:hypothetical protein
MSIRTCIAVVVVVLSVPRASVAQTKPDFSGDWTLNRQASMLSPAASGIQGGDVHIEHKEPQFRYKATLTTQANPIEYEIQFVSDASPVTSTQAGAKTTSSLRWEGDALVLSSTMVRATGETTIDFRYELIDGGRRLRANERIRGGGRDQNNVWVFDRR